jgi:NADH:ubiquinone oxidoreductase subunit K
MKLSLILFLIGILGFVLNRKNIILMLMSIEIMLLSITFLILISSLNFDDILGQTFAIYIITIAGTESAIGLGILVAFYRFISFIIIHCNFYINNNNTKINNCNIYKYYNSLKLNKVSYNTLKIRNYSTTNLTNKTINPWFITGLIDAEGCFNVSVLKNLKYKTGLVVQSRMQIKMHERDRPLILEIQKFFGGIGYVSNPNNNSTVEFRVSTIKDIIGILLPHFDKYPLLTKKSYDYILFKKVVLLMESKAHTTFTGLQKIINYKASINKGLSEKLKKAFPLTEPTKIIENNLDFKSLSPEWIAGFSTGESNFFITVQKSKNKKNLYVSLRFSIGQHTRDLLLLKNIVSFFNCGYVVEYKKRLICEYIVTKIDHIDTNIIPFFDKYPIKGYKYYNYLDFKNALDIIKNKEHLNSDGKGLEKLLQLKKNISITVNKVDDSGKDI